MLVALFLAVPKRYSTHHHPPSFLILAICHELCGVIAFFSRSLSPRSFPEIPLRESNSNNVGFCACSVASRPAKAFSWHNPALPLSVYNPICLSFVGIGRDEPIFANGEKPNLRHCSPCTHFILHCITYIFFHSSSHALTVSDILVVTNNSAPDNSAPVDMPPPELGATFVPGGFDDYYMPEVVAPSPQRYGTILLARICLLLFLVLQ